MATVLTRTVASFFSNNGVIISKNIAKKGIDINEEKIVLAITEKKYINEFDEVYKIEEELYTKSTKIRNDNHGENKIEKHPKIIKLGCENAISAGGGCECEKCKPLNAIDIEKGMENVQYVYAICITKMGLLDYIVYHHRTTYDSDLDKD
ncbi:12379_t:CDS:1 [Cetraspora pellucida]|uniref:12379_t:CDS:1 n=1 Tax=Cetraspora pellucida TaxID=1433469 RepID=A0A9N9HER1_9GLOM|nr:12379_t:CDS:1 [Cetraspora pellucida]